MKQKNQNSLQNLPARLLDCIFLNNIDAICFQTTGNFTLGGKAIVDNPHSIDLFNEYPQLSQNLAFKLKQVGNNIPFIVGAVGAEGELLKNISPSEFKDKKFQCLILSFPTKVNVKENINFQLLKQSLAVIEDYMKSFDLEGVVIAAPKIETTSNVIFI